MSNGCMSFAGILAGVSSFHGGVAGGGTDACAGAGLRHSLAPPTAPAAVVPPSPLALPAHLHLRPCGPGLPSLAPSPPLWPHRPQPGPAARHAQPAGHDGRAGTPPHEHLPGCDRGVLLLLPLDVLNKCFCHRLEPLLSIFLHLLQ